MSVIYEDTRNKPDKNAHIREQIESLGHKVVRQQLYVGDYQISNKCDVSVDTKQDLNELCSNVIQDHDRFRNECLRAQEAGISLIVLVADEKITSLSGVYGWWNPRKRFSKKATSGRTLGKILFSMEKKYGVKFEFCKKSEIGKRTIELLGGDVS